MKVRFTKMQGVGNDFVVLDAVNQTLRLDPVSVRKLADRHFGVGCDQVLVDRAAALARHRFLLPHLQRRRGRGAALRQRRALLSALRARQRARPTRLEIRVETLSGVIVPRLEADGEVTVDMGAPELEPEKIPFVADKRALTYRIEVDGKPVEISALSMGNPHAVQVVADVEAAPVLTQGPLIERHARFPERVNAGYLEVVDRHRIKLRVYERGAGETLACGTGACAAVVAGISRGLLDSPVRVTTHGGDLRIAWGGGRQPVLMTGPAETVFEGEIEI